MRCYPLLHGSVYAPRFRSTIDPWTWGAVISTLNDATLQHDDAELGHHPHREWMYYALLGVHILVALLNLFLHNFSNVLLVLSLVVWGVSRWDRRLGESRLEGSITVRQQALQKEFDGAVVMSLEGRKVWIQFRSVDADANQTATTSMSIV